MPTLKTYLGVEIFLVLCKMNLCYIKQGFGKLFLVMNSLIWVLNLIPEEWLDFHENIVKKLEYTFKKVFDVMMFIIIKMKIQNPMFISILGQDITTVLNLQEKNSTILILVITIIVKEKILFPKNCLKKSIMK